VTRRDREGDVDALLNWKITPARMSSDPPASRSPQEGDARREAAVPEERTDAAEADAMPTAAGGAAQDDDLLPGLPGSVEPPD
jgi:hypothetical protein